MEELKELFGDKALSYEDFNKALDEKGIKIGNLSSGGYVAKTKYDEDIKKAKNSDYKKKFEDLQASIEGDDGINAKIKNLTTERDDYKSKYESLNKDFSILNATNKVTSAGIKPEFAKFVANEVLEMTSDTIDFDTALKSYKAKNPQFSVETTIVKKNTSVDLSGKSVSNENTTNQRMNDLIRSARD